LTTCLYDVLGGGRRVYDFEENLTLISIEQWNVLILRVITSIGL
jgi:hypothetical protein